MLPRIFLTTPRGQEPVGRAVVTESQSEHYVGNRNMAANIKGKKRVHLQRILRNFWWMYWKKTNS